MVGSDAPLTIGTAGHIDHGKTSLVIALTGKDTDRLPEEHARGMSIDLGYAPLDLPSGRRLSVVDVPGHERFVRTMVAGATGIDLFLLCVAADDGVMPQTREHLAVLRALGVESGVIAITKSDLADPSRALAEIGQLLPDVAATAVAASSGVGFAELRRALDAVAATVRSRARSDGETRLHVDRSFAVRGVGTVVTGTLWSGEVRQHDRLRVLPASVAVRVRSVESHDQRLVMASAGQRVALNLVGISWREIRRGDVVCGLGSDLAPAHRIIAEIAVDPDVGAIPDGTRLQVHHGTRVSSGRIRFTDRERGGPAQSQRARLLLESPLVALRGDRFVLRQVAPPATIGGGVVLGVESGEPGRSTAGQAALEVPTYGEIASPKLSDAAKRVSALLREDGSEPRADGDLGRAAGLTPSEEKAAFRELRRAGLATQVTANLHFDCDALAEVEARAIEIIDRDGRVTLAGLRDQLNTSRRFAQAVLEHLDRTKRTRRVGESRVRRRA